MRWGQVVALSTFGILVLSLLGAAPHAADEKKSDAHVATPHDAAPAATPTATITPDQAMQQLVEGNERYVADRGNHPNSTAARRCETFTDGQHPIVSVLACADSRVPVEMIFDQGIGDIFVTRVAGNVADTDELGTLEYGAGHLHTPLIVIMGHSKCGAVTAVVQEAKVGPNIAKLVDNIVPAVQQVRHNLPALKGDALVQAAIDANVFQGIADVLKNSDEIRELVEAGKVKVIGAVYDIHIGSVRWLGEHPRQAELLHSPTAAAHQAPKVELLHPAPAAKPAEAHPTGAAEKTSDAHATPKATGAKAAEHPATDDAHPPISQADDKALMPHQRGMQGMMIPAAFIGGSTLLSGLVFRFMKFKGPDDQPKPQPAPQA